MSASDFMRYWPVAAAVFAFAVAWGETRIQVAQNTAVLEQKVADSKQPLEDLQDLKEWRSMMDERTSNMQQTQQTQQIMLQQILEEVRE